MDDECVPTYITAKPKYHASLRLDSGMNARVTVMPDAGILFGVVDDEGRPRESWITDNEAREIASMLHAADRSS